MRHYRDFLKNHQISSYTPKGKKKRKFPLESDDIITLDIEVSSGFLSTKSGMIIPYIPHIEEKEWNGLIPVSCCYIWQFSYNNVWYYGREFKDFKEVLKVLPKDVHFIIWVHNLGYEFDFMQNLFSDWEVFAREAHHPMKAIPTEFPNIEFRCSYILTRKSLDCWGKELELEKLHSLEYTQLRTPKTKLTKKELEYCQRDCEVVYRGISTYLARYGHICDIPLTQTGEVRKVIKAKIIKDRFWYNRILKLLPRDAKFYEIFRKAFRGGDVAANYTLAGLIIGDQDYSDYIINVGFAYDFASSYPFVMCSERFPMTPFREDEFDEGKVKDMAYILHVKYVGLYSKTQNHYISASKCDNLVNHTEDNGRVIDAQILETYITEQDYDIIKRSYGYEKCTIMNCWSSRKEYLPRVLIDYVLELYANKTSLKGVDEMLELYGISKQFINSLFGMCVTSLVNDEIVFVHDGGKDQWKTIENTEDDINAFLCDLKSENRNRTFLGYQWGVWITAYARHNLWECMLHEVDGEMVEKSVIYRDTDSLKLIKNFDFTWYNDMADAKLKAMCDCYGIDFEKTRPKTADSKDEKTGEIKKGKEKPLGWFAREDDWTEFVTLGAKRYCYRDVKDNCLHLTVAGVNKDAVLCLKDDIRNFTEDFVFDKDYTLKNGELKKMYGGKYYKKDLVKDDLEANDNIDRGVSKKLLIHTIDQPVVIWNKGLYDEYECHDKFGCVMRPTSYSMGIADKYAALIAAGYQNHLKSLPTGYEKAWDFAAEFKYLGIEWDESRY